MSTPAHENENRCGAATPTAALEEKSQFGKQRLPAVAKAVKRGESAPQYRVRAGMPTRLASRKLLPWDAEDIRYRWAWQLSVADLSATAKYLGTVIAIYAGPDGIAFPSQATLAYHARVSERHVRTLIPELERCGLLRCEGGSGRGQATRYRLTIPENTKLAQTIGELDQLTKPIGHPRAGGNVIQFPASIDAEGEPAPERNEQRQAAFDYIERLISTKGFRATARTLASKLIMPLTWNQSWGDHPDLWPGSVLATKFPALLEEARSLCVARS